MYCDIKPVTKVAFYSESKASPRAHADSPFIAWIKVEQLP